MSGTPKNKKEEKTNLKTSSKSTNKKENLSLGENLKKGFNNLKKRWNKAGTGTKSFAVASVLVLVLGLVGFIGFNNANQDADQASASNREIVSKICPDGYENLDSNGNCTAINSSGGGTGLQANGCPAGYVLSPISGVCIEAVDRVCPAGGYTGPDANQQCTRQVYDCPDGGELQGNLCVATSDAPVTRTDNGCFAGGSNGGWRQYATAPGSYATQTNGNTAFWVSGGCVTGVGGWTGPLGVCDYNATASWGYGKGPYQGVSNFTGGGPAIPSQTDYGIYSRTGSDGTRYFVCGGSSSISTSFTSGPGSNRTTSSFSSSAFSYVPGLQYGDYDYAGVATTNVETVNSECPANSSVYNQTKCLPNNAQTVAPSQTNTSTAPGICPTPTTFTNIPYQELNATQCYRDLPDGSNQGGDSGYGNCEYGESNYGNNNCPNNGGGSNTTTFADGEVSITKDVPDTVTAGSEVTERIYFDNTASESADSTNITSQLPNGFTLVDGSTYYGTSCYNTNTTGWRIATPSVPTTMNYGIGGQIGNKVYIVDSSPNNLYVWERNTNQWSTAATPPKDFTGAGSAVVNGKLYIYGNRNTGTGDLHVYDPTTNTWEQKAGRTSVTWTNSYSVIGDDIYVLGGVWGDVFKKYETDTDTWVDLAGRPRSSEDEHSTLVPYNGKLYSFGGNDGFDSNRPASRSHPYIYEYTPSTDSWTTLNTTAPVNTSGQVATVYNGKIYLAGGFSASDKKVYSFDPVTGLYTDLNLEMPESAYMAVDARFGDQWYIFGNESPSNAPSTKVLTLPDQRVQLNNSVWNGNSITLSPQGVQGSGDLEANSCGYIEFKMKAPSTNGTFNQSASMNSPEFSEVTDSATITVTGGSGGGDTTNDGPNDANIDGTESNNGNDTNNDGLIDGLENITPDGSGGVDGQTATTGQPTACTDLSNTGCVVDAQGNPNSNFNDNDIDGDGIPNSQDTDMDGDGFNNWFDTDTDQDGINNEFDNDDDNDGIPDDQDDTPQGPGSGDNDGDDIPDGIDADIDGDGDNNGNDLDGDGIIDTDSDGNATGCDDLSNQGCVVDDNGNPNSNYTDDDIDGDGIPNDQDNDIDGDGAPNQVDDDADQDGFTNDGSNPNGGSDNNGGNTTDGTPDTNDDNDNLTDIGNDPNQDGADTNGNDPTPQGPTSNDADIDNDNGNGNGGSNNANDGNGDGIIDGLEDSNSDGNGGQTGTPDYTNCQSTAGAATGSTAIGGTNSNPDCVTDNQGNPNDNYTDTDIDGDGIPNQQDTDMDGDGINNQDDNDVDQDGYNNDIDNDDDNDGIPDAQDPTPQGPVNANNANIDGTEANNGNDTNNDGVIDGLENSGSDGQGGIEGQTATNNIPTPCNESQAGCVVDSDGVPNSNYTDNDIDGDGIPNDQDDDMDGDGVLNTVDNDIDQDGYNNEFDLDDDNDGILDTDDDTQSGTTDNIDADVDDDGELNGNDTNNDDIIDGLENSTGDGNGGIANQNPSTGDNMPTACNDAATNPDCIINSDGTPNDNFDESDIDGDNIPNTQDTDLDGDGVPNWLDNDADQDGYNNDNDLDDDNDGIPDDQDDTPQGPGSGNNDGDNQVDGIDADVDDDGANNGNDLDGDGVIDTDANGNPTGCSDASNPDCVVDGDGVPVTDGNGNNNVDPDIDGDGIPNEDDYDMDGDGSPNTDDDDTDQDGFTNDVDLDDDNDGILDVDDPTPQGPVDPTDADIDNDGLNNGNDTNDDGIIDGLEDAISDGNGGVTDQNGNPITPTPCDPTDPVTGNSCVTDENGIPTDQFQDGDIDGDGTPNTSDTDIDGDGVPNNQDNDVDQDGYNNDVDLDDDNDGILDVNDPTPQGPGSGTDGDLGFGDCVLSACILLLRDDATSPGDYYVDPGVELPPVYKDDEDLTFVVNTERTACQDASTITTRRLRVRNNKFAGDDSRWIDITDTTGLQSGEQIRGVITREMRNNNEVGIENVTWSFEIDLVCDGRIYKAQNNYGFAIGALAVVNVSGDVIP
jgi:hypothetical protein